MQHSDIVPRWVRVVLGVLALANIAFGIMGYAGPAALFQNSTAGIDLGGSGARYAGFEFASRNLAIGLALLIVSLRGVPESIAIVTIIRALIEIQTVVIAVLAGTFGAGTIVAIVMASVEIFVVKTMVNVIAVRDAKQAEGSGSGRFIPPQ
jgi:hypothetical protein